MHNVFPSASRDTKQGSRVSSGQTDRARLNIVNKDSDGNRNKFMGRLVRIIGVVYGPCTSLMTKDINLMIGLSKDSACNGNKFMVSHSR